MNLRLRENPWRLMLAVNVAVLIGVFLYKITREPYVPYIHLLVDYHFGFTKRALIGAVVSLFTAKVPVWLVFALSGAVWLITLGLFVKLFRRTFGFDDTQPAAVRVHGRLAVLSEEFHAHARAFRHLRLRVRDLPAADTGALDLRSCCSPPLASMILILIHHIHLLMYVPTIAVIVVLRYYLVQAFTRQNAIVGIAAIAGRRRSVPGRAILADRWRSRGGIRQLSAEPDGRSVARTDLLELSVSSGISRFPRKSTIPGNACRPTCWAYRCSRC